MYQLTVSSNRQSMNSITWDWHNKDLQSSLLFFLCSQKTFHYNSKLWSNKVDFNLPGGKTGLDTHETKLPTYWNTPFNKICLGMKIGQELKSVVINHQARSLYSLIADGKYRATSLGRNTWKKLIGSRASLQPNCNKEGFNVVGIHKAWSKARIAILGNNENDCSNCNSRIGFGTGGHHDDSNTCGNEATAAPDNGYQHIKLWDTSWFTKSCSTQKKPSNGLKIQLRNRLF